MNCLLSRINSVDALKTQKSKKRINAEGWFCSDHYLIDEEKTAKIQEYATKNNTSVYMLLMTALGSYINRIKMNQEKFYIGTAILNRTNAKEKNIMGMFINTAPVLMELANEYESVWYCNGMQTESLQMHIDDRDSEGILKIHNEFTVEYLRTLGFEWSDIDFEYIKRYIEYFRNIEYLKV